MTILNLGSKVLTLYDEIVSEEVFRGSKMERALWSKSVLSHEVASSSLGEWPLKLRHITEF